jgi:Fe-S-cluster containining protein
MMEDLRMPQADASDRQNSFFETCSRCKNESSCCFGPRPPIIPKRKRIIEVYLKNERIPIADPFARTEYVFPRENAEGYCVFYDVKTTKCLIHPVKPETCVAGPITFDINKQSGRVEWYIKMEKICPLAGIVYKDKQLLKKHLESAKTEIFHLIDGLNHEELTAILKKEEPETFKIGEDSVKREGKT